MSAIALPTPPKCHGYILISQHPYINPRDLSLQATPDPYAIVPCPFDAIPPTSLSVKCAGSGAMIAQFDAEQLTEDENERWDKKGKAEGDKKGLQGCAKGSWCERHWCAGCKRASEVKEGVMGFSQGQVISGRVVEESPVGVSA